MLDNPLSSAAAYSGNLTSFDVRQNTPPPDTDSKVSEHHASEQQTPAYQVNIHHQYQSQSVTYSHLSVSTVSEVEPALLEGASTILRFIEQRIATEKAEGASDERIDELLQQGLAGFKQGYGEAIEILGGSDGMETVVDEAVTTLYQQVLEGIDSLRVAYLGESNLEQAELDEAPVRVIESASPTAGISNELLNAVEDQKASTASKLLDGLSYLDAYIEYSRRESFAFELTTVDGDKVSIQANQQFGFVGGYSVDDDNASASESTQESSRFVLSVEGELDEQEIVAIENLLEDVFALADEFYQGDIESAYQAALDLGYDQNEITGYALSLRQVETYYAAAAYQQLNPESAQIAPELRDAFELIGNYAQSVLEALTQPVSYKDFAHQQLVDAITQQIAQQIENQSHASSPSGFYERLQSIEEALTV